MKLNEGKFRSPKWLRNYVDFEVNTGDDISGEPSKRKTAKMVFPVPAPPSIITASWSASASETSICFKDLIWSKRKLLYGEYLNKSELSIVSIDCFAMPFDRRPSQIEVNNGQ